MKRPRTSKFLIVPFGLGGLWVSWDDFFFAGVPN